ncbi:MAG TPA: hypothetical protein VD994_16545, partial [Prosthecobacter sp.]|nr:hypothetical protein [Prosthecobacter sp.]
MRLGYHYHIPVLKRGEALYTPGFAGVFLDALASQVQELRLFLHEARLGSSEGFDYRLTGTNITWVNLGEKTSAWRRSLFHRWILARVRAKAEGLDAMLVRSPSPL